MNGAWTLVAAYLVGMLVFLSACTVPVVCPEPPDLVWDRVAQRCVDIPTGRFVPTECCEKYLWGNE